jgi:hypothetical protein
LRFVSTSLAQNNAFGSSVSKDTTHGRFLGYNVSDHTSAGVIDVALTLKNGLLYGHFTLNRKTGLLAGVVTGGSAAYTHVRGTINGQATSATKTSVTVVYHR